VVFGRRWTLVHPCSRTYLRQRWGRGETCAVRGDRNTQDKKRLRWVYLWLRYNVKTVDLARLKRTCKVKVGRTPRRRGYQGHAAVRSFVELPGPRRHCNRREEQEEHDRATRQAVTHAPSALCVGQWGNLGATLVPGTRTARCVGRGVALGALAVYAWLIG
jgi:hypothetical protein